MLLQFISEPYFQWVTKEGNRISLLYGARNLLLSKPAKITPCTILVCSKYIFQCLTEVNLESKRPNDAIYYEPGSILMRKGDEIFCKPPELRYSPIFRLRDCMFPTLSMLKRYNECFAV